MPRGLVATVIAVWLLLGAPTAAAPRPDCPAGGLCRAVAHRWQATRDALDTGALRGWRAEAGVTVGGWIDGLEGRLAGRRVARRFGLSFVTDADERLPLARLDLAAIAPDGGPPRVVVLVHGLDDPGWMWRDVIPALRRRGFVVARMEYPNDGPITEAATLFGEQLRALLGTLGIERIDVVAHSMGGLVTRQLLTMPDGYAGRGEGGPPERRRYPAIDRFVMCGTPNHGSELVRLRAVSEIRETVARVFRGEGGWLGGLADGRGEAADDLLPGSEFLDRLNARPPATFTRHTIIAGRMSPVAEEDVADLADRLHEVARSTRTPMWLREWLKEADEKATRVFAGVADGLGDGCVALDSARLDGLDDLVVVDANHMGMIVALIDHDDDDGPDDGGDQPSSPAPPAIPIILDRLARPARAP